MLSWSPPRAVTRGAAYGGGGLGMVGTLGAAGYALLKLEAKLARRAVPPLTAAPMADGEYGDPAGIPLRLVMLGDSGGAGFGADVPAETPGAILANELADAGRRVTLETLAYKGARCADLDVQVTLALADRVWESTEPSVNTIAVINIGANDVTHWNPPKRAVAHLVAAVTRLRSAGVRVVVGTCPDLGALALLPQPLRTLARVKSAQMAAAQAIGVVTAGGVPVALGSHLGKQFSADPAMVCFDRFHPSGKGYQAIAGAMAPAVRAAAGIIDPAEQPAG
ncbi:MAG: SGNH/GDSL hydrolase family protein [Frankiaceae bacterium]